MAKTKLNPHLDAELRRVIRPALLTAANAVRDKAESYDDAAHGPWMPRKRGPVMRAELDGERAVVVNSDYAAHLIEFGSQNNPAHAPLRRAVRAVGLRFKAASK